MIKHGQIWDIPAVGNLIVEKNPAITGAILAKRVENGHCLYCGSITVGHADAIMTGDGAIFYLCKDCKELPAPVAAPTPDIKVKKPKGE